MANHNPEKINACYCRVSTEMQREKESIEAQRARLEAYCIDQGQHPTFYMDDGYSAKNTDRPALHKLITDIKAGKVESVILTKIDRITRSIRDLLEILELFEDHNVSFKSITQPIDTKTAMGRSFIRIIGEFAQLEREIISERVSEDKRYRAKKGVWNGGIHPFGYKSKNKKLVINEPEAHIVKQIFRRYLSEGTFLGVTEWLNGQGYRPRYGSKWSAISVRRILTNPVYIGQLTYGKRRTTKATNRYKSCPKDEWITSVGEHEGLIDVETFNEVAELIQSKNGNRPRRNTINEPYLLTGLIKCGKCGSAMHGRTIRHPGKTHVYYVCSGPRIRGKGSCPGTNIPSGVIEQQVLDEVMKMSGSKQSISRLRETVAAYNKKYSEDRTPLQRKLTALNSEKVKLLKRKDSLVDLMLDRVLPRAEYELKAEQLDKAIRETETQVYQAENTLNGIETDVLNFNAVYDTLKNLKRDWKYFDIKTKQAALSAIVHEVKVFDKQKGDLVLNFSHKDAALLTTGDARDGERLHKR